MSSERDAVEVVRTVLRAMRRGDLDGAVGLFADDCKIQLRDQLLTQRTGAREFLRRQRNGAGRARMGEPERLRRGAVRIPLRVEVEISGERVEIEASGIWTMRDGLVASIRDVQGGRQAALAELNASRQPRSPRTDRFTRDERPAVDQASLW